MSALGVRAPADILYENLAIQNNIFHNSYLSNVKKLIFLVVLGCIHNIPKIP